MTWTRSSAESKVLLFPEGSDAEGLRVRSSLHVMPERTRYRSSDSVLGSNVLL